MRVIVAEGYRIPIIIGDSPRREFKPNESEVENFTRGFLSSRVPWRCIEQVKEMCDIVAVDESTCDKAFSLQKTASGF